MQQQDPFQWFQQAHCCFDRSYMCINQTAHWISIRNTSYTRSNSTPPREVVLIALFGVVAALGHARMRDESYRICSLHEERQTSNSWYCP
jgi:hypothetical protein